MTPGAWLLVLTFQSINPLCIIYCRLLWTHYYPGDHRNPFTIGIYASIEAGIYFLAYIPCLYLQQPTHPPSSGKLHGPQALFQKRIDAIPDPEKLMSRCREASVELGWAAGGKTD
jgi:hypothetical protein